MRKKSGRMLILILGLLTAIGPLSIDMYLPSFTEIAADLGTPVSRVMLSLSSFFIGISVGQFLYGPLLERFGRKKPVYFGIVLYFFASLGCAFTGSVDMLIAWRLLQALGGCAGMVAARAMVRDLFDPAENARIFSTLMLVVAVSPIIAPTLGGYITAHLGWRFVFGALMLISLVILAGVYFVLPESRKPDKSFSLRPGNIISTFAGIAIDPRFFTYALTGAFTSSALYAYISGSPAVFMELYGVNERQYGWIFALIAAGLIAATQFNSRILYKYRSEQIVWIALFCQVITGLVLAAVSYWGGANLFVIIFLILAFLFCQGFIFPNTSALSLAAFAKQAGSASALLGAVQMGIGAGTSALVSVLQDGTAFPMAGVMLVCSLTALLLYFNGRHLIKRKSLDQNSHLLQF
jgi:DHA1 family bicyclomycin/chloramphenicol resistance-like MFS transporter